MLLLYSQITQDRRQKRKRDMKKNGVGVLAVEAPRFRKGSGAKEDSSPASSWSIL
jgi:hypothetical protein